MSTPPQSILIVEDDASTSRCLVDWLENEELCVHTALSTEQALALLEQHEFGVVLSDVHMPSGSGLDLLRIVRDSYPETPVVMMTAFASVHTVMEALRTGAFDFLSKPIRSELVVAAVRRALQVHSLQSENAQLRQAVEQSASLGTLIGESPAMKRIQQLIRKVAPRDASVLITGESGTGKEVVARTIHELSPRASGPFVAINCAALPRELLESELFGHVRGAFSGAHQAKTGLLAAANGGTLLLDEIGDMNPDLQGKLLRVIQERSVRPVGGLEQLPLDIRILAATHRDLLGETRHGRFRLDLYYRLNVVSIHIPPLRERPDDIEVLAREFLRRHGGLRAPRLTSATLHALRRHPWKGNARELENAIERALALCEGAKLLPRHFPLDESGSLEPEDLDAWLSEALSAGMTIRELTDRYIEKTLEASKGNKAEAARLLGINRRTLYRWERDASRASNDPHEDAGLFE